MGSTNPYHRPATGRLMNAGFNYLSDLVVRPGIQNRFWPILLYRGGPTRGTAHRLWNFALLMMASEAETLADAMKLGNNPAFSQLCGPVKQPQKQSLYRFFLRLWDNPDATDLIPSFTEYVRSLELGPSHLKRVELETYARTCAPWRISLHPDPDGQVWRRGERGAPPQFYPYMMHDAGKPEDGRALVKLVNDAVPKNLPEEWRADVCQEMIVAVLSGDLDRSNIKDRVQRFISDQFKEFAPIYGARKNDLAGMKWSMDAPLGSRIDMQRTLHDVMHDDTYAHWSDQEQEHYS